MRNNIKRQAQETIAYQDPWAQASLINKTWASLTHLNPSTLLRGTYPISFHPILLKNENKILSPAPTVPVTLEAHQRRAEAF